jgi:hypothetical protein
MRNKTYKVNKKRIKERKKTFRQKTKGGKAIDAGSYGCVFKPALKCVDSNIPYSAKNISKLMYTKDAEFEMSEMKKVEKYIKNIPNNDKYFLVSDTYNCKPDMITDKEDLLSFDKKCGLFTKHGIDSYNVNDSLSKLELINMPNGGLSIENFILKMLEIPDKYDAFIKLNNALIKLLVNGIIPINKLGFNHFDVKAANILFSPDGNARLIDWGLAGDNDGSTIPEAIIDRSIAFNMPFSDIFFNSYIKKWLPEEISRIKASPFFKDKTDGQADLLKVIAVNLINKSIQETSEGHFEYITSNILHDIYKIYADRNAYNKLDYNVLTYNVLIEYIQAVLVKFVDENGNFNARRYFYEVFSHNVDIWGFILAYAPLIEDGYGKLNKDLINGICRILLKYCFSPEFAVKPIVVSDLTADLSSLSYIAGNISETNIPLKTKMPTRFLTKKLDTRLSTKKLDTRLSTKKLDTKIPTSLSTEFIG